MTDRDYPCPDCERDDCGGLGCIGRVRMEAFPFTTARVCRVPERKPEPVVVARTCEVCDEALPEQVGRGRPRVVCSDECRAVSDRRYNAAWMRENRPSRAVSS